MRPLILSLVFFLSVGVASAQKLLPLENQNVFKDDSPKDQVIRGLWYDFEAAETKSKYETKQEYIDRLKDYYNKQPFYFFETEIDESYDAETQMFEINLEKEYFLATRDKENSSFSKRERYQIVFTNFDSFFDNEGLFVSEKMSPESAMKLKTVYAIFGVDFVYDFSVDDFNDSFLPEPRGVIAMQAGEFHLKNGMWHLNYNFEGVLKSVTLYTIEKDGSKKILKQKHTFNDDSSVFDPKKKNGISLCFIGSLK